METKKPLIILTGPTAVGKTKASINLAKQLNGEIISADSMQVYKYMNIGTAKITPDEMNGVKHYLVDELLPSEPFSVAEFQSMAKKALNTIYDKGKVPIIVGGTGFYIQALLYDIDFTEVEGHPYREELERLAQQEGVEFLHQKLQEIDPEAAKEIHANNVKRVIRAIEFFYETGEQISAHNEKERAKESPYNFCYFVLNDKRENLYKRIDDRIDIMVSDGLIDEVKNLLHQGYHRELVSMQGLGYKEIVSYLEGEISLEDAIYILKRDTRHFAKRQITWFKREKDVIWIEKDILEYNDAKIQQVILDTIYERIGLKCQ